MRYRDEKDKCYGVTGMAIGLTIFDADNLFSSISIEGEGLDCIEFTPDYYIYDYPEMSANDLWQMKLEHYQVTTGMVIADALCRKMFRDHSQIDKKMRTALYNAISEDGKNSCQLEDDEVETIFEKSYRYLMKVLSNRQVKDLVESFAKDLHSSRTMSRIEVLDKLHILRG